MRKKRKTAILAEEGVRMMPNAAKVWQVIIAVMLAVAGGLARLLSIQDRTKLQLKRILSELFISAFAGLMVLLLSRSFGLEGDWLGLVCGMAGWIGPRILDLVAKPAGQAIGLDINSLSAESPKIIQSDVQKDAEG